MQYHYMKQCFRRNMGWIKLEHVCTYFAVMNLILKTILMIFGFAGSNRAIVSLVSLGPSSHQLNDYNIYDPEFVRFMRMVLIIDCLFSIVYSVALIIGVRRNSISLLKSCVIYGSVILFLSSMASIPRFIQMLVEGEYDFFGQRFEAFVLTIICAIQVLIVYMTYQKFRKMEDLQQLIYSSSEQQKKKDEDLSSIVETML